MSFPNSIKFYFQYDQEDAKDEIDLDDSDNQSIDDDKIKFDDVGEEDDEDDYNNSHR